MTRTSLSATLVALLAAALALGAVTPAAAQEASRPRDDGANWTLVDALGYGGLGFGLGLAAAADMEGSGIGPPAGALVLLGASTATGVLVGAMIGNRAGDAVAGGRGVGGGHRAAVLGGAVMAGATLGTLAAIPLIEGEGEGTPLGSDERTLALLAGAGGAAGALYAWSNADELSPRDVTVAPAASRDAGIGVVLRARF